MATWKSPFNHNLLAALAFALPLQGCGDLDRIKVAMDDRIVKVASKNPIDASRTGVAFMSLGKGDSTCSTGIFSIFFRPLDGSLPGMSFDAVVSNLFGVSNAVMRNPDFCVEVIGMSLPPGNYQITGSKWFSDTGMQTVRVSHDNQTGVPFTIKAGEVTYLGSFQMVFAFDKGFLGKTVLVGGRYGVSDDLQRDKQKLDEMRPELKALPVIEQLPPDDNGPDGFPRIPRRETSS